MTTDPRRASTSNTTVHVPKNHARSAPTRSADLPEPAAPRTVFDPAATTRLNLQALPTLEVNPLTARAAPRTRRWTGTGPTWRPRRRQPRARTCVTNHGSSRAVGGYLRRPESGWGWRRKGLVRFGAAGTVIAAISPATTSHRFALASSANAPGAAAVCVDPTSSERVITRLRRSRAPLSIDQ